jgi:hypothetical protein
MSESTRRGFLKVAGAAGAVAGVTAVAAAGRDRTETGHGTPEAVPAGASGPLVAYVRDVRGAEVSVLVDGSEVVVHDRALVARLAAARRTTTREA